MEQSTAEAILEALTSLNVTAQQIHDEQRIQTKKLEQIRMATFDGQTGDGQPLRVRQF